MTTIDTSPETATAAAGAAPATALTTIAAWSTSSDHKRIGRLFIGGGLVGLIAVAVLGVLLGIERLDGSTEVFSGQVLPELFQAFRIGLVLVVMAPLAIGLSVVAVPLQVGSRALAFPRAALAGFYAWLAGVVLVVVALANDGGIGGGDTQMVGLFLLGHGIAVVGLMMGAGSVATTVLTTRAPGMTMRRVPMFAWSALVGSLAVIVALPVMIGMLIYLSVDIRSTGDTFGGSSGIGVWLGWVFTLPTLVVIALPALGVLAETTPVVFGRRLSARPVAFAGLALVGTAAFAGVTQQDAFTLPWSGSGLDLDDLGQKVQDLIPFALFNLIPMLGVVIVLGVVALAAKPVKDGPRPKIRSAFVFSFFGLGMVLVGLIGNALAAIEDLGLRGTVFEEGAVVYVAYGSVLGVIGGVVWWAPKLWGRTFDERKVLPLALLGVLATVLASLPYYIAGFADQPAGAATFDYSGPAELWNALVLVGHGLMALTVLAVIGLALSDLRGEGETAGDDPWDAHTLEWATTSPAPGNNFPEVPTVTSAEPLLDLKTSARASNFDGSQS